MSIKAGDSLMEALRKVTDEFATAKEEERTAVAEPPPYPVKMSGPVLDPTPSAEYEEWDKVGDELIRETLRAEERKRRRRKRQVATQDSWNRLRYSRHGYQVGRLVAEKQEQYGDSVGKTRDVLRSLWPQGVPTYAYGDLLLVVRVLDKLARLAAQGVDRQDQGGESPWRDIAGYALLALEKSK